ncbi:hypothetical protein C7964_10456 [Loktanella sp. PT4BL]|jgi:hypothetical protein|uniref:hypothetical protein n=1 Tax=Loktanella sp. PT4BL TaxID=2135611 RepID=UPI000D758CC0|nr:hypothetical protein [Loktanella sp. PT4BL]PXW67966.1 hypothetical protein C7964_10456 [Loktanella sp. PT4BL]
MITNFALSLSLDGIELLHRVPRGWRPVGRVDVASKTLEEDLSALREKALLIEPDGLRTKLVIPLDQIKYLALDGTRTTEDDIHAALDGATPYALGDLVIDSEKSGGRTHVAAVARETLNEAEAFADAHGFQPVAFVAVPEPFTFQKEVFFGPTDMARSIVGPDAIIERDDLPVMPVGTRIKSRLLVFDQPENVEEDTYKDDLAILMASQDTPAPVAAETGVIAEAEKAPAPVAPRQAMWIDRIPPEHHARTTAEMPEAAPASTAAKVALAKPVLLDLVIPEHHRKTPKKAKSPLVAVFGGQKSAALAVSLGTPASQVAAPAIAPQANRPTAPDASRPKSAPETNKRPALIAAGIAAATLVLGGVIWSQQTTTETAALAPEPPVATEEVVIAQAPLEQSNVEQAAPEAGPEIAEFRVPDLTAPQITGSELATTGPEAPATRSAAPAELAVAAADAPLTTVQAPPAPPVEETETAEATVGAPVLRAQVLSPDEAERIYDATGVWQRAPRFFDIPSGAIPLAFDRPADVTAPDRIKRPDMAQLDGFETDLSFIAPANPPAPDVTFARDADGFILATEEGTVTPEGALVFAGLPDLAITPRPELSQADLERFALLAPAPEGVVIIPGTPAVVPPLRPADAALPEPEEAPEDTTVASATPTPEAPTPGAVGLGGLELQNTGTISLDTAVVEERALVDLRPRLRPQGLAARVDPGTPDITDILAGIAAEDATLRFDNSTALAVVLSIRPDARPSGFANVVAAASARTQPQPAPPAPSAPESTAPVVAAAPVAPQNVQPVPGGVARAATQEDAIRLREINLIGVYGRPNARRALVRLSNGRYVRVEIGSELDGGQVTAIGDSALNYVKRGRTYAIELP